MALHPGNTSHNTIKRAKKRPKMGEPGYKTSHNTKGGKRKSMSKAEQGRMRREARPSRDEARAAKRKARPSRASSERAPKGVEPRFHPIRRDTLVNAKGRAVAAEARAKRPSLPDQASDNATASVSEIRGLATHYPGRQYRA